MKWKDKLDLTHGEHISKQVSDSTNTFYIWQMSKWTSHRPCCITGLVFYQYHEITSFIRSYSLKKRISVKTFSNPAGSLTHAILKDSLGNSGKSCAEMNDDSPRGSWATWGESVCTPWPASEASTRSLQVIRMNQNGFRLVCLKNANTLTAPSHRPKGEALQAWWAGFPSTCHLPSPCCTRGLAVAAAGPLTWGWLRRLLHSQLRGWQEEAGEELVSTSL